MSEKFDYDLIIIGSGAAGMSAARAAAANNIRVAIIENELVGSKSDIYRVAQLSASDIANQYYDAKKFLQLSNNQDTLTYNYPSLFETIQKRVKKYILAKKKSFANFKIDLIHGDAHFISPYEVAVANKRYSAKRFLICTGRSMNLSTISGIETTNYYLPEDIFMRVKKLPKIVLVVGAGKKGIETAEYLAKMGCKVIVAEKEDAILEGYDKEAIEVITNKLVSGLKIKILTNTKVVAIQKDKNETVSNGRRVATVKVTMKRGADEKTVRVEAIVFAISNRPNTELGLENAGIKFSEQGIVVNDQLETSVSHIFAAGDVAANPLKQSVGYSTEKAAYEGTLAVNNILKRNKLTLTYRHFSTVLNTTPKIVTVGLTEKDCLSRGIKCKIVIVPEIETTHSLIASEKLGFLKLICDKDKKLLGATIVAKNADLAVMEIVAGMYGDLTLLEHASMPHINESFSDIVRIAAKNLM